MAVIIESIEVPNSDYITYKKAFFWPVTIRLKGDETGFASFLNFGGIHDLAAKGAQIIIGGAQEEKILEIHKGSSLVDEWNRLRDAGTISVISAKERSKKQPDY